VIARLVPIGRSVSVRKELDSGSLNVVILPEHIQERIAAMPEFSSGVHRVTVELADGRLYPGVEVAWHAEIIRVPPHPAIPFRADEVVDVYVTP
jgi:hypothetical protein